MDNMSDPMDLLTAPQVAERLGISVRTLTRRRDAGEFPAPANTIRKRPVVWRTEDIDALLRG